MRGYIDVYACGSGNASRAWIGVGRTTATVKSCCDAAIRAGATSADGFEIRCCDAPAPPPITPSRPYSEAAPCPATTVRAECVQLVRVGMEAVGAGLQGTALTALTLRLDRRWPVLAAGLAETSSARMRWTDWRQRRIS